jgi:hypothetical protein
MLNFLWREPHLFAAKSSQQITCSTRFNDVKFFRVVTISKDHNKRNEVGKPSGWHLLHFNMLSPMESTYLGYSRLTCAFNPVYDTHVHGEAQLILST